MAHFEQQIADKQLGWQCETRDGTWYVPGDVHSVPAWIARDAIIDEDSAGAVFTELACQLQDYCGADITEIRVCKGYFARLSAPSYLDCTEWECHATLRGARDSLED